MDEIGRFLLPLPGENPAGANLRYVLHDKLQEARREEDTGPRGTWEREVKTADYKAVVRLGEAVLLNSSKDLWIAAWLTEAWTYEYDLPGLTSGLRLLDGLMEQFWDFVYPEIDEGDLELRAAPVEWVGSYFDPGKGSSPIVALRKVPLTQTALNWFAYQESRRIGAEAEVRGNEVRVKARAAAVKEGKVTPEVFDKDFEGTPKVFYKDLERDAKIASEALEQLDENCRQRFSQMAPSFSPLRKALEEFSNVVHILVLRKLEKEPDPITPAVPTPVDEAKPELIGEPKPAEIPVSPIAANSISMANEITSNDEAALHVINAAQYLRRSDPANPVAHLLLRALRWGELRKLPAESATKDLPAPLSATRFSLRSAAAAENYKQVLEIAETAMSSEVGRGWLDLQRYSIIASDKLGHASVAKALRSELKAFLHDFPQLPQAIMADDTGTANPETLAWLRTEGLIT